MKVQVSDDHAYNFDPIVVDHSDVAKTIMPWFVDAPGDVEQAIRDLQRSLDIAPRGTLGTESAHLSTSELCAYLGITLRLVDAAHSADSAASSTSNELTQDEINTASKLCRSEGVPTTYVENVARILRTVERKRLTP